MQLLICSYDESFAKPYPRYLDVFQLPIICYFVAACTCIACDKVSIMIFGIGIGDFIKVVEIAHKVRSPEMHVRCTDAVSLAT